VTARSAQDFSGLDHDKFNKAYSAFDGKMHTFARNAIRSGLPMEEDDVVQELCYVLMRCVRDYDPNKAASFNTFAQSSFQRKIIDLKRKSMTKSRTATLVYIDQDEVRAAVDGFLSTASAEDIVTAIYSLDEETLDYVRANLTMGQIIDLGLIEVA
jgi:RNA polymerase sigma factor (sigma-70 family)